MFTILTKHHWLSDIDGPDDIDPTPYQGRVFRVTDEDGKETKVVADTIQGSVAHPTKFQINTRTGSYLISMLDFFAQVNGTRVSKADIEEFDEQFKNVAVRKGQPLWQPNQNKKLLS